MSAAGPAAALAVVASLAVLVQAPPPSAPEEEEALRRAARLHSLALAEMEEGSCEQALEHLDELAVLLPDNVLPPLNRAVCLYRTGRSDEARAALDRAARIAPRNPRVLYTRARLLAETGAPAEELTAVLDRYAAQHPGDPRPLYLAARAAEGDPARRVAHLRAALDREPENVVLLADLLVAGAAGRDPETVADALNGLEDRLDGFDEPLAGRAAAVRDLVAETRLDELAPAAVVVRNVLRPHGLYQQHLRPLAGRPGRGLFPQLDFDPPLPKSIAGGQDIEIAFAEAPVDGAHAPLVVFGRSAGGESLYGRSREGRLVRLAWDGASLRPVEEDGPTVGTRASLHDFTGDGITDLATVDAEGRVTLRGGRAGGGWGDALVLGSAGEVPVRVLEAADLDHDGDLDLFAGRAGAEDLFFENRGAEWAERAAERGLAGGATGTSAAAVADFDDDGDLDLVVTSRDAAPRLLLNRRAERFGEDGGQLARLPAAIGAETFDADGDGRFDLLLWGAGEPGLWLNAERGFVPSPLPETVRRPWSACAAGDLDNDGDTDLAVLIEEDGALWLVRNRREGWTAERLGPSAPGAGGLLAGDLDDDGDLDLVAASGGSARFWRNEGGSRNHWIRLVLEGRIESSGKNNSEGLHARIEARVGGHFQAVLGDGGVNHVGLGAARQADVVRVVWTNGVAQTWQMVAADRTMVEEQVLKGSCPFLYTWDGERFRFVTDLMWPSPLGMIMPDGSPATRDSARDWVAIPSPALQAAGDSLWVQVTEELWETAYVDEVALVAVDAPPGVAPLLDEALRPPPYPTEPRLFPARELRAPVAARDGRGEDVTGAVASRDGWRVDRLRPSRYQGLVGEHSLELTFENVPEGVPLRLVLQGWVFPTDTSINYALAQDPGRTLEPPRLELRREDGSWTVIVPFFGFPKGKEKAVVTDVTGLLPAGTATVRVATNQEIYWDAAALALGDPDASLVRHRLRPAEAHLHYRGYSALRPRRSSDPHLFDYEDVSIGPRWRDMEGRFTRHGPVTPLLAHADDRLVVMNAGDELTARFSARSLAPPPGWSRHWLLYLDGWVKDADIHTAHSTRVGPLPYHGMTAYPDRPEHRHPAEQDDDYHGRYQTREVDDRPFREALRAPGDEEP